MPRRTKRRIFSLTFLFFALAMIFFLFEANFAIYSAFISIFRIPPEGDFVFMTILFLLSGGFLMMLILERYFGNYFIRFFYLSTSVWMGAFVYIFLASSVYILLELFIDVPEHVGSSLLLLAGFVSLYGIYHGEKIKIKKIKVSLPNLPDSWNGKKAVWISDVHLCSVRRDKFAKRVVSLSNLINPDLVFIGGDLFDGTHKPNPALISKPFKDLISKDGAYFIPGNHEEFGNQDFFFDIIRSLGIRVLFNEMIIVDGVQIVGVDYITTLKKKDFREILEGINFNKNKTTILLKHEPKDLEIAEKMGVNFQISGHTHRGQQWPLNYLAWIAYKGFDYGLKKYKSMLVYVSSGVGGWGPPLRVGTDGEIVEITFIKNN